MGKRFIAHRIIYFILRYLLCICMGWDVEMPPPSSSSSAALLFHSEQTIFLNATKLYFTAIMGVCWHLQMLILVIYFSIRKSPSKNT